MCLGVTIFLYVNAGQEKGLNCQPSIFWTQLVMAPTQLLFRALPSVLVMDSHRKNY